MVIVDIQNDYFPGGRMELHGSDAASQRAGALLAHFRSRGLPVIHVQHISIRPGSTFFLPDTEGVRIHPSVAPAEHETVIRKHFPNAFRDTALADQLRQQAIDNLVIVGMMTHMCVDATTRAAADLGFTCSLASDACATRTLSFGGTTVPADHVHCSFLAALNGAYAAVRTASELAAD
ncbi:MAG TPA: cysteine hydrolase family protein [Kofleriaceae bacterium]|nr:cysteine hydrolase family protein [Kofleriaceae bacterium]